VSADNSLKIQSETLRDRQFGLKYYLDEGVQFSESHRA
jgi:hypothetical protein